MPNDPLLGENQGLDWLYGQRTPGLIDAGGLDPDDPNQYGNPEAGWAYPQPEPLGDLGGGGGMPSWLKSILGGGHGPGGTGPGGSGGSGQGGLNLAALAALLVRLLGRGNGQTQQLQQIQDLTRRRMEAQNPLFEAVSRLALSRLPMSAQAGLSIPSLTASPQPVTTPWASPNASQWASPSTSGDVSQMNVN